MAVLRGEQGAVQFDAAGSSTLAKDRWHSQLEPFNHQVKRWMFPSTATPSEALLAA